MSSENIRAIFYEKKSLSQMIQKCLIWREKEKQISAGAAVPPPILHSSILYLFKATAMPNLKAVAFYLVEFLCLLVLVWRNDTSAPSLFLIFSLDTSNISNIIKNCLIWQEKTKQNSAGNGCFRLRAFPLPFLHSSTYTSLKQHHLMKFCSVILFCALNLPNKTFNLIHQKSLAEDNTYLKLKFFVCFKLY